MKLSEKILTVISIIVTSISIVLWFVGDEPKVQSQVQQQVIIQGDVTVGNESKVMGATSEN